MIFRARFVGAALLALGVTVAGFSAPARGETPADVAMKVAGMTGSWIGQGDACGIDAASLLSAAVARIQGLARNDKKIYRRAEERLRRAIRAGATLQGFRGRAGCLDVKRKLIELERAFEVWK